MSTGSANEQMVRKVDADSRPEIRETGQELEVHDFAQAQRFPGDGGRAAFKDICKMEISFYMGFRCI